MRLRQAQWATHVGWGSHMRAVGVAMEERKIRARGIRRPNPASRVGGEDRRVGREVSAPAIGLSGREIFVLGIRSWISIFGYLEEKYGYGSTFGYVVATLLGI